MPSSFSAILKAYGFSLFAFWEEKFLSWSKTGNIRCIILYSSMNEILFRWKTFRGYSVESEGDIKYLRADSNISEVQTPEV